MARWTTCGHGGILWNPHDRKWRGRYKQRGWGCTGITNSPNLNGGGETVMVLICDRVYQVVRQRYTYSNRWVKLKRRRKISQGMLDLMTYKVPVSIQSPEKQHGERRRVEYNWISQSQSIMKTGWSVLKREKQLQPIIVPFGWSQIETDMENAELKEKDQPRDVGLDNPKTTSFQNLDRRCDEKQRREGLLRSPESRLRYSLKTHWGPWTGRGNCTQWWFPRIYCRVEKESTAKGGRTWWPKPPTPMTIFNFMGPHSIESLWSCDSSHCSNSDTMLSWYAGFNSHTPERWYTFTEFMLRTSRMASACNARTQYPRDKIYIQRRERNEKHEHGRVGEINLVWQVSLIHLTSHLRDMSSTSKKGCVFGSWW